MSLEIIARAIEKRIAGLTPAVDFAPENGTYVVKSGTPYQQLQYLGQVNDAPTIAAGYNRTAILYQVTVCYPSGQGAVMARKRADAVAALFKKGTVMVESGLRVEINFEPDIFPALTPPGWFCIPVQIRTTTVLNG